MDRAWLEALIDEGLSLEEIGELVGRDPSTIGYWCKKHGLTPNGRAKHAARGGLTKEQLEPLVRSRLSTRAIAAELGRSQATVRYWLKKYGLNAMRERAKPGDPKPSEIDRWCSRHGRTRFVLEARGAYRCAACRSEAPTSARRRMKQRLVAAKGGKCERCGYDRNVAALQFHHIDPAKKAFAVSNRGDILAFARHAEEAEKCSLLCANCHAEVEWGGASLTGET